MLPDWVKKCGKSLTVFLLTIASCLASVSLSWFFRKIAGHQVTPQVLFYAFIIPLFMTPVIGVFFIHILFELDKAKSQLAVLSMTDDLTGLFNRRYMLDQVSKELARSQRYGCVFSILSLDLDDFKVINDKFGHPAGDRYLKVAAEVCSNESRLSDVVARYGGDEFAILAPGLDKTQARCFAERIKTRLAQTKTIYHGHPLQSTVSVGVITWEPSMKDLETLLFLLDKALYAAKGNGKNQTVAVDLADQTLFDLRVRTPGD